MNTLSASTGFARCGFGLALVACCAAARATEPDAAERVVEPAPMQWSAPRSVPLWSVRAAEELRPQKAAVASSFSIVELPSQTIPGTRAPRPQHALSIQSQAPQRMLRSMGIEATDCATRLRMPSKLKQSGGSINLSVQAHVGLACRF
ncbi:hypothetical protein [uncultured Methylibium sp.]|uniref:hypothetical protein n=1 Tax=uncultured Methylibium sp. TaxID=381093 RepID=UPI0025E41960|nr:hypothetical protein [uncultured Methylibium sp.]